MLEMYKINDMKTAFYSPQSNAAERVNQSILNAIRTYLDDDHTNWDLNLSKIELALRTSVSAVTGVTPFFALFGYNMFTCGRDYKLARKLKSLSDGELYMLERKDRINLLRDRMKENLHHAYEKSAVRYNRKARVVRFLPGQEVYKRNFVLSSFKDNRNAKFCRKFIKCRISDVLGNNMYKLETLSGESLGDYHAKDIKQ